jgi:DNA-binding transcriptional ArsR family regulator
MDQEVLHANARRASCLLKAMSNQHRLLILCQLLRGEKCVGELERLVGLSQSAMSQNLARLRRDNLVKTRRQAQTIYYSLAGDEAVSVLEALYEIYCQPRPMLAFDDAQPYEDQPRKTVASR